MEKELKEPRYMMATKAIHKLGDISRDTPDLAIIDREDELNYIGNWVCGLGFVDVKFPKETTKELTEEDHQKWNGKFVGIAGSWSYEIKTK